MTKIAIVTDTDSSLPADIAAENNIQQVPINVQFDDETLESGVNINDTQLFERVDRENKLPTTSAPSPGKFAEAYQTAFDSGAEAVICFTVSSEISAVYNAAVSGVEMIPDGDITVVDSRSLSLGQGFMVLAAAQAASVGASKEEILSQVDRTRERTHLYGALSTLKYLAMSGRVGYLAAGMANLLNVKPILTIQNGKLDLLERVRTRNKAWARMIELILQAADDKPIERMGFLYVNAEEEAHQFHDQLCTRLSCPEKLIFAELTPGLSVHTGAGLVGVTFVTE